MERKLMADKTEKPSVSKQELEAALKQATAMADEIGIASIRSSSTTRAGSAANKSISVTFNDGRALMLSIKPPKPKKAKEGKS
jgi:hypothetical protein